MPDYVDWTDARKLLEILFPPQAATDGRVRLTQRPGYSSPWSNYGPEWLPTDIDRLIAGAEHRRGEEDIRFGVALYKSTTASRHRDPSEVPALWVRSMAGDWNLNPLPEAPPSLIIGSSVGREVAYGWLLDSMVDAAKGDELVVALAEALSPEFEPVLSDGFIRLPDTGDHTGTFSQLVRLREDNARRYSIVDLSTLVRRRPGHEAIAADTPEPAEIDTTAPEEPATDTDIAGEEPDGRSDHASGAGPSTIGTQNDAQDPVEPEGDDREGDGADLHFGEHPRTHEALELAEQADILAVLRHHLRRAGFVGDTTIPEVVFLVGASRLLARPVSIVVLSASSTGKSFSVEAGLAFLPKAAYHEMTSMSSLAIYYTEESLRHRILVLAEAAGIGTEQMAYALRSLLSAGRLRREVTDYEHGTTRVHETEGPTGGILTSTGHIDTELNTRVLTYGVSESAEQTREVLDVIAAEAAGLLDTQGADHELFKLLQGHLAELGLDVVVPFAPILARLTDAHAVRMRRDFSSLIGLIKAHALLHHATRRRDSEGRVTADARDYVAAHRLASASITEAVESSVSETVRSTVRAVQRLLSQHSRTVSTGALARELGLDGATVRRRIKDAVQAGYVIDKRKAPTAPHQLVIGDPLPEDRQALPTPQQLEDACSRACTPEDE